MSKISILFDRSEPDELGIRFTAKEMGVEMNYIPFYKTALRFGVNGFNYKSIGKDLSNVLKESEVVLNRTQSKSRRLFAASILEALNKNVVNSLNVEQLCSSKVKTLLSLFMNEVNIPETLYIPSNIKESIPQGGFIDNTQVVSLFIEKNLPKDRIVLKPDGGTHGKGVILVKDGDDLSKRLQEVTSSIINPSGVLAQEYVPKWFYDLRIIVYKNAKQPPKCAPVAMARAGFQDFRTNTYLGNKILHISLPPKVIMAAIQGGKTLLGSSKAGVLAFDAMPYFKEKYPVDEEQVKDAFNHLDATFKDIQEVKKDPHKKKYFTKYTEKLKVTYQEYKSTEAYIYLQEVIQESLNSVQESLVFHECNACPEFWEQTQQITGVNVAKLLVESALSLI